MGQSNSRRLESAHTPTPTTESQMSVDSAGPSSESSRDNSRARYISEGSESRGSSARRSLLNLVRAGNIRRRVSSAMSSPGDSRRSWRHSNRWSKMPAEPSSSEEPLPSSSSTLPVAGPSSVDKGKRPERTLPDDEDDVEYHEAVEEQPISQSLSMPVAETVSSADNSFAPMSEERTEQICTADPMSTPSLEQISHAPNEVPPDTSRPPTSTTPLPARQFPPPGTLVIVQGVVHTTDISRANHQPELLGSEVRDDPAHHNRTRERLSSLLRPPRPSVQADAPTLTTPSEVDSPESNADNPTPSSEQPAPTTFAIPIIDELARSTSEPLSTHSETPDNRLPSISSSSIDVLGTLLSVAAAATAASLLTGSSEPILSSGLAPPPPITSPPPQPTPVFPRMLPDASAISRADRMRQAWSTIRERLGLRPSIPHPDVPTSTADEIFPVPLGDGSNSAPADARELMLAEMARAFNIGLGLNGSGAPSSNDENGPVNGPADTEGLGPSDTEAQHRSQESGTNGTPPVVAVSETVPAISMPPEGSFERFLVDLQLDLRVALTHVREETLGHSSPNGHAADGQLEQQPEDQSLLSSASTSLNMQPSTSNAAAAIIDYALTTDESPLQETSDLRETATSDSVSMPLLESDSESDGDDFDDDEDFHSAVREGEGQQQEGVGGQNSTTTSGMGRIDASGRINWWRLYRFPQITSLSLDLAAGLRQMSAAPSTASGPSTTTPNSPSASTSTEPIPPPVSVQSASGPTSDPGSAPPYEETRSGPSIPTPPSGTPSGQPPRSVVPVIIVGLQSVHPELRTDAPLPHPPPPPGENDVFEPPVEPVNNNGDTDFGGSEDDITFAPDAALGAGGPREGGRPRGWQSRAANAIRNLRPSRRNADPGQGAQLPFSSPSGSRTFLIYVIGGYYPPDHSIVTGGPNNFDSFEALLELADLLGQVKPSTVSKEDIENSGLEVIKASLLPQFYKENKITANCLDRCLVCLEDYQPEDDVRVMKCRHVFHQACVDEWMQKGRNNCPTCRSTGVQSTTETPAETA